MRALIEPYRWKILAAGICLLSLWFVFKVLVPGFAETTNLYNHLQNQREKIASAENWEKKLARFASQEERLNSFFSDLSVSMSNNDRMSTIVELVFNQARDARIRIRQMRPLERVESDTYTEIPVAIRVEGRFHNIATFANNLEQAQQSIRLSRISLLVSDETTGLGTPMLTGDLVINVAAIHHEKRTEVSGDG